MKPNADDTPRWGLWATLIWSAVVMAALVFVQFGVLHAYVSLAGAERAPEMARLRYDGDLIAAATLLAALLCVPLIAGIVKLKRGARLAAYLPFAVPPGRTLLAWLGIMVLFIAAADLTSWLTGRPIVPEVMQRIYVSADHKPFLWAALILAAPLFEEILFRGFMLAGLAGSRLGPAGAVVLTSGAWALLHAQYDWYGIGTIVVFGVLLGVARVKTGTLFVPFLLHVSANAFATLETLVVVRGG